MAELFEKEVSKLERTNSQSPDFNVQLTYLQTLLGLPWNVFTTDNLNISNAEKTLNKDHYGLEKVKERILEHLAVLKLKGDMKSPIICLYGPPGVGKTSLGRSIAASLKRKYVRMSLGGVHDEAEIRGHRKTYIGAMPGRIIKSLIKAESSNPVIILDEIDKLGSDHRGDPSSAMLEVLDPEQNNTFHDNYLDVDYDLSKVMFIATANNLSTIPPALLDRMELIEVSGYITEEKVEIARRHLVPKELEANGIKKEYVKFSKAALECIVENYTRESGVRELEKKINKVMRKIALEFARDGFVSYSRRKTGKKLIIRWEKQMQEIIDRYGDSETQYLLPIIEREDGTERRQYRNKMLLVNRKLKKIAARAGLTTPLTMYVARHSWASIAKTKNISIGIISEAMGHDSETTTQIYLSSIQTNQIDNANRNILKDL